MSLDGYIADPADAEQRWPRTTFVAGVDVAVATAKEIAGDHDVTIASADIIQQALVRRVG